MEVVNKKKRKDLFKSMFWVLNIVYLTKSVQNYEFFFQKAKETDFFV